MKRNLFLLLAILLVTGIGLSVVTIVSAHRLDNTGTNGSSLPPQGFLPNDNQVCFYENANYGGGYICLNADREYPDLNAFFIGTSTTPWDNKISSLIIGANVCALMYENANGGGYCLTLHGNGNTRRIPNLTSYNFNDKTSHIKCNWLSNCMPKEPASNEIVFFEHSNYDGYYMVIHYDNDQSNISCYNLGLTPYNWNDKISSIKVGTEACVTTWFDANYKGQRNFWEGNGSTVSNYPDLGPSGIGDRITSYKVRPKGVCAIN